MRKSNLFLVIGCAGWLGAGCGGSNPPVALPPPAPADALDMSWNSDSPEAPLVTEIPVIEIGTAEAPMEQTIRSVLAPAAVTYFRNDDGDLIIPKSTMELLQRAVYTYSELQEERADGEHPWPRLTELSQLVQYRVLTALPAPPPGQKFVYDPATRRVSVAAQ
jgi:hypothetical protein